MQELRKRDKKAKGKIETKKQASTPLEKAKEAIANKVLYSNPARSVGFNFIFSVLY